MSIYRCDVCDEFFDDDWNPCYELGGETVCEECYNEQMESKENDRPTDD